MSSYRSGIKENILQYALQVAFPSNKRVHIVKDGSTMYLMYRKGVKIAIWKLKMVQKISYFEVPHGIRDTVAERKIEMHGNRVYVPAANCVEVYRIEDECVLSYTY